MKVEKKFNRKLGEEWLDWDGKSAAESTETDPRVFLVVAAMSTIVLVLLHVRVNNSLIRTESIALERFFSVKNSALPTRTKY